MDMIFFLKIFLILAPMSILFGGALFYYMSTILDKFIDWATDDHLSMSMGFFRFLLCIYVVVTATSLYVAILYAWISFLLDLIM